MSIKRKSVRGGVETQRASGRGVSVTHPAGVSVRNLVVLRFAVG